MTVCVRCFVSGRVQGVWFRGKAQLQARGLGLTGHARNLPDGRVEVLACGPALQVERFGEWLWQGPPAAEVTDVRCEAVTLAPPDDFVTG